MLAWHLGWRYLCKRRTAWLAVAAITLTVAVPVVVLGVIQGFVEITEHQARANESDLTTSSPWFGRGLPDTPRTREVVEGIAGVSGHAPYVSQYSLLAPEGSVQGAPCLVDGIDWTADSAIGRLAPSMLHPRPVEDLSSPALTPDERGTGFLTPAWRAHLALSGLDLAAAFGVGPLPPMPRNRPTIGVVAGREVLYSTGMSVGLPVTVTGITGNHIQAIISDTIGSGILEIDRFALLMPIGQAQIIADFRGKNGAPNQVGGWRLRASAPGLSDRELRNLAYDAQSATGMRVETWMDRRGNMVKSLALQRNIMALVMIAIQAIAVFIVYAVFSTLVAEKRQDIGVLFGLGARRRDIAGTFLFAGLAACLVGSAAGWALGWGALAALNPLSRALNMPLFPQDIIYTPEAPTSFNPLIPLFFAGVMTVVGILAVALPAWRASRIQPVAILREGT